jgi:hypothetical protein
MAEYTDMSTESDQDLTTLLDQLTAADMCNPLDFNSNATYHLQRPTSLFDAMTSSSSTDYVTSPQYDVSSLPVVTLSDEEKTLLTKEGLTIPSHLPLTRQEQKQLNKVLRMIRNKDSAKASRKRKQQYIEGLEHRVKLCTIQNWQLHRQVQHLEQQNMSLLEYLRKLQTLFTRPTQTLVRTQTTYLMVFLLSFAILLPALFGSLFHHQMSSQLHQHDILHTDATSAKLTVVLFSAIPLDAVVITTDDVIDDVTRPPTSADDIRLQSTNLTQNDNNQTSLKAMSHQLCAL